LSDLFPIVITHKNKEIDNQYEFHDKWSHPESSDHLFLLESKEIAQRKRDDIAACDDSSSTKNGFIQSSQDSK